MSRAMKALARPARSWSPSLSPNYWQTHLPSGDGRGWKAFAQMTELSPVTPLRLSDRLRIVEELSAIPASLAGKEVPQTPEPSVIPEATPLAESQTAPGPDPLPQVACRLALVQSTDTDGHVSLSTYLDYDRYASTLTTLEQLRQALQSAGRGDWTLLDGLLWGSSPPPSADRSRVCAQLWPLWDLKHRVHQQWLDRHLPLVYQPATIEVPCVRLGAPGPRDKLADQILELSARHSQATADERRALWNQLHALQKQIRGLPADKRPTLTLTVQRPTAEQVLQLADAPPGPARQAAYRELFGVEQQELEDGRMLLVSEGRPYVVAQDTMRRVIDRLTELHDPMPEEDC